MQCYSNLDVVTRAKDLTLSVSDINFKFWVVNALSTHNKHTCIQIILIGKKRDMIKVFDLHNALDNMLHYHQMFAEWIPTYGFSRIYRFMYLYRLPGHIHHMSSHHALCIVKLVFRSLIYVDRSYWPLWLFILMHYE